MKFSEVSELLRLITSYDRSPFPEGAADTWFHVLRDVAFIDATEAVHKHYRVNGHDDRGGIRKLLPVDVARVAGDLRDTRLRREAIAAQRKALEAPMVRRGSTGRPADVEALLAAARAKAAHAAERYALAVA